MAKVFALIEEKLSEHNLSRVTKVVLKIGELTCIEESSLRFAFAAFAQETPVEGAELVINWVEPTAYCENCRREVTVTFRGQVCPNCSQFIKQKTGGEELQLTQIEGE